jgi:flagellum-specific ATP synthase
MGHYPAIDVLGSVSRIMPDVLDEKHLEQAYEFRRLLADYRKVEDLVNVGAYEKGTSKRTDDAVEMIDELQGFMKQDVRSRASMEDSLTEMTKLLTFRKLGNQ